MINIGRQQHERWIRRTLRLATPMSAANIHHHDDAAVTIDTVKIYDNVYNPETCLLLHQLAQEHSDRIGDDSSIFYRNHPSNNQSICNTNNTSDNSNNENDTKYRDMTALEYVIDTILTNVCNDTTTNVVEYWSRQDYMNMDVHCDIDEKLLETKQKKRQRIRCPEYAHILYLTVQLPTNVTAPTCIFPTKRGGWMKTTTIITTANSTPSIQNHNMKEIVDLVVVPAVSGRVVRFPGSMMHAVPRPSDQWFASSTRTTKANTMESKLNVYHDDDDEDENELRSVLLFNCWSNDMPSPFGLKTYNYFDHDRRRSTKDVVPDGIVIDDDEHVNPAGVPGYSELSIMPSDIDYQQSTFAINDQWTTTPITPINQSQDASFQSTTTTSPLLRVRLMGNKYRRQYHKAVAQLSIYKNDEEALMQAIKESIIPTRIQLLQINEE